MKEIVFITDKEIKCPDCEKGILIENEDEIYVCNLCKVEYIFIYKIK